MPKIRNEILEESFYLHFVSLAYMRCIVYCIKGDEGTAQAVVSLYVYNSPFLLPLFSFLYVYTFIFPRIFLCMLRASFLLLHALFRSFLSTFIFHLSNFQKQRFNPHEILSGSIQARIAQYVRLGILK